MNFFPFHVGDYLTATRHLSWEEDLAYRRMLDVYYTTGKALPREPRQVCRLILATTEQQRGAVQTVLDEFFEPTAEGWVNRRAEAELTVMREKQQKQRDKANSRWQKERAEPQAAPAMPGHPSSDAVASDSDAAAMPPTPTPTPTPTPVPKRRRAKALSSPAKQPTCQTQAVIDVYHEVLPEMPKVRLHTKDRVRAIQKVWAWVLTSTKDDHTRRAETAEQAVEWFRVYFEHARGNDFLMGRTPRTGQHANWRCDLDFLLSDRGMKHVIEKTATEAEG